MLAVTWHRVYPGAWQRNVAQIQYVGGPIEKLDAILPSSPEYSGLALADRQFVISERISQMTKGNVTAFVNLTKAIKQRINSMFLNVFETNCRYFSRNVGITGAKNYSFFDLPTTSGNQLNASLTVFVPRKKLCDPNANSL